MGKGPASFINGYTEHFDNLKNIRLFRVNDIHTLEGAAPIDGGYFNSHLRYDFRFKDEETDIILRNRCELYDKSEIVGLTKWFENKKSEREYERKVYVSSGESAFESFDIVLRRAI